MTSQSDRSTAACSASQKSSQQKIGRQRARRSAHVQFVKQNAMMVLTTGVTATCGMLAVFACERATREVSADLRSTFLRAQRRRVRTYQRDRDRAIHVRAIYASSSGEWAVRGAMSNGWRCARRCAPCRAQWRQTKRRGQRRRAARNSTVSIVIVHNGPSRRMIGDEKLRLAHVPLLKLHIERADESIARMQRLAACMQLAMHQTSAQTIF